MVRVARFSTTASVISVLVALILGNCTSANATSTSFPADQGTTTHTSTSSLKFNLSFSTYLGGSQEDTIRDVTADAQGNIYVAGGTASPNFPITIGPAFNTSPCSTIGSAGPMDAFIAKFSATGSLLWSRLMGASCYNRVYAIEVDKQGYIYIGGRAGASYPTTPGSVQPTFGGQDPNAYAYGAYGAQDGFVTKLSPDGTRIIWSTYFGSDDWSFIRDIDVDSSGNVYLVMPAVGRPSPHITTGAFQTNLMGGDDMIVAKLSSDGARTLWATYLGGSGDDGFGPSIRVDGSGHAYVLGTTNSTNFPTTPGAFQRTFGGTLDFVVTKFTPDGSSVVFSTYLGRSGEESTETHELALDAQGNAYITGYTGSLDFPTTPGAFQRALGGNTDVALAELSTDGTRLLASTYLGGSLLEGGQGIAVDAQGNVNVFGLTSSRNFPVTAGAYQSQNAGNEDAFVARLSPDLSQLLYATFLGGSGLDEGRAGCVDANGNLIMAGTTQSDNWPLRNAIQTTHAGGWDATLAKFSPLPIVSQEYYLPFTHH